MSIDPTERTQKTVDVVIKETPTQTLLGIDIKKFSYVAKRKKVSKKPPQPRTDSSLQSAWIDIINGEQLVEGSNLVHDICDDIVMLGSQKSFELLQENNAQVFCDGTFKYAPRGYLQMYTLHIVKETVYTPVVYFLLKNKLQKTYTTMFSMLKSHCPELNVGVFQMDFELAAHKAAKEVFPEAEVRGCRFHLAQAWFRKLGRLGLQSIYYNSSTSTAIWLKTVFGLPGLPPSDVEDFFTRQLMTSAPRGHAVQEFISYLMKTYIAADSKFPPIMWAGILDGRKHTTNGCESFHRHFGRGFVSPHPNIYDWLSVLSMSHKRSLLSCHVTNRSGLKNAQKLTAAVNLLKSQFETKQIDSITFVKLIALNLMTASKKRCQKRSKSIIDSIKNKYKNKVTGIVNRLGM